MQFLFAVFLLFPFLTLASPPTHIPNALWESETLPGAVMAIAIGDVDGDGDDELTVVDEKNITVFSVERPLVYGDGEPPRFFYENTQLKVMSTEKIDGKTGLFRAYIGKWNADHVNEILLTGFQMNRAYSVFYRLKGWELKREKELAEIIYPVGDELRSQSLYPTGGATQPDLFATHTLHGYTVAISRDNQLQLYKDKKRLWKSSLTYGGAVGFVPLKYKDALGLNREKYFSIQPRIVSRDSDVFLVRNEVYLDNIIGKTPRVKTAQLVLLGLSESSLTEKHVSPRYQGAITDLALIDWDGDGHQEVIFSFLINQFGYLSKDKGYQSIVAIVSLTGH